MRLTQKEIQWLLEKRINRLSDHHEVLIYPMGAERYLSSILFSKKKQASLLQQSVQGKRLLVMPGYGNNGFLFAYAGADVTVYDQDPVTIAWLKAFKKFYHYRPYHNNQSYPSIGECLDALTRWYPPYLKLPTHTLENRLYWIIHPQFLRRAYIFYMISLVQEAILSNIQDQFELDLPLCFYAGNIEQLICREDNPVFDNAYVPYLLGVQNGIEEEDKIVDFIKKLFQVIPEGYIFITPARNIREFYILGRRYFETTTYPCLDKIPELSRHVVQIEKTWFRTQGMVILHRSKLS